MKSTFLHSVLLALSACALASYFVVPTIDYAAESAVCTPVFGAVNDIRDFGVQPSVAAHRSGLILEFHKTENRLSSAIWYRVGALHATGVVWGGSQRAADTGWWPTVALSEEGHVILVHSASEIKNGSNLYYRVGEIDPYGGINQSILWKTETIYWDAGFHSSVAMNDNGVIVGVHETGHARTGIYYRVGHLRNPAGGDYTIQWDSGQNGIQYDNGINPHVAINNLNQVVAVHQVTGESLLQYRRGTLSGGTIHFGGSKRYDDHAERAAVALLDSGVVLEVHSKGGLISRTGTLNASQPDAIAWSQPIKIDGRDKLTYPALAMSGTSAIATCETDAPGASDNRCLRYTIATNCGSF